MKNPFEQKTDYEEENKNNMSYWFPLLKQIGMRVPKTIMVDSSDCKLGVLADGKRPYGYNPFAKRLKSAINEIGLPCFLRTGMTSDKHSWKDTCYIDNLDDKYLISHVANLVEHSCLANIAGLPFDYSIWAVRELIPTKPIFTHFNSMPIVKERRMFINKGKVICNHPYWPREAFGQNGISKVNLQKLQRLGKKDEKELELMAKYVGRWFTGYWSVDFLQDKNGLWWLTDMAVGGRSYHYPNCKNK